MDASFTVGTWTYNGSRTGYLPADIMMGLPSSFVQDSGRTIDLTEWKNHFWVQDDWKVNDRLTVNAGLRWEPWTPPTDSLNNLVGFVKGQQSTVAPDAPLGMVYPGDTDISESLFSSNYGLFAPRIGAAYDLFGNGKTVLRGGYGIFYVDPALTIYTRTVSTQPSVLTVSTVNPYSFVDPYNGVPGGNPYPFPRRDPSEFATFKLREAGLGRRAGADRQQGLLAELERHVRAADREGPEPVGRLRGEQGDRHPRRAGTEPGHLRPGRDDGQHQQPPDLRGHVGDGDCHAIPAVGLQLDPDHRDEAGLAGPHHPVHLRLRHPERQRLTDG
ncbi:MAG: TonB-dependent receptor [Candidatus Moduliflexus flocculans]|nr:TonB-dependent receptor [Candidatus Moduliflexus flocculans]